MRGEEGRKYFTVSAAGAFKAQGDEELDSKPLIIHSGGEFAVRAGCVPLQVMMVLAAQLGIYRERSNDNYLEITGKTQTGLRAGGLRQRRAS